MTTPRRALVPRHTLEPRHALEASWHLHGLRLSRRVLLILGAALMGGPLAYIVMPQSVAALPGGPHSAVVTAVATPVRTPAFVAGLIEDGDLITNPVGVVTTGPTVAADGELIGWPVTDHTPSTGFGYRSDPFTHRQRWHDGVDLGQPCGDPAWASLDGTVVDAGWAGGYGNRVVVRHADRDGHTFATTYNHLAKIEVNVGQQITRGQVVGRIGSTGRSTACHMHFEVILDGSYVDPMRFLTGDMSKAALSRRVGSYMPSGLPSPNSPSLNASPTPTRSTTTPTPTHSSPSPTPSTTAPRVTPTPTPSNSRTPTPTPTPTTPTPTPSPTGSASSSTPGIATPATTPAPSTASPAGVTTPSSRPGSSPAATASSTG